MDPCEIENIYDPSIDINDLLEQNIKQQDIKEYKKIYPPDKERLLLMLEKEELIRLSNQYIQWCDQVKDEINGWIRITNQIQQKIVYSFGYKNIFHNNSVVNIMRRAAYIYPDDIRFQQTQLYVRHNRAAKCPYQINDQIPEKIDLFDLNGQTIVLNDLMQPNKYNIVFAASAT